MPLLQKTPSTTKSLLLLALLAAVVFLPYLGSVHLFDWDEINFAEAAREMLATGEYSYVQINYEPFQEKPPLFFWLQALSMKAFGVNEFAARLPNALCGVLSLITLFSMGTRWHDRRFGWWWAGLYAASLLPHFYFKSGIIDPWFNLFIFAGIYFLIRAHQEPLRGVRLMALSGLFIGLGVMTKGPVALLIFGLVYLIYWASNRFKGLLPWSQIWSFTGSFLAVGASWFLVEVVRGRGEVVLDFIVYQIRLLQTQDAGHGGPFYYHFIVLLLGCFPASLFFLYAYRKPMAKEEVAKWMKILFWVVLLLFSLVRTKIVHYSSLCYFPLTYLGALGLYHWQKDGTSFPAWLKWSIGLIGTLLGLLFTALPLVDRYKTAIIESGLIKDRFAVANLQADVYWGGWEWLLGILFWLGIMVSLFMLDRSRRAIVGLLVTCLLGLELLSLVYIPKVEQYSQGAAIAFYESKQEEDCYLLTVGFKSYAHLFYGLKPPPTHPRHADKEWLLSGESDKPVYVVTKNIRKEEQLNWHPQLKVLYEKNGFVFMQVEAL
ncbi:ArnT family glycosyltransferase [Lewinella sp. LCG006]|uniref:ArnT family glycosyltransferase n=1 Tax=Lewinella sp. LCG006 TaxID=3231911 RepID=UPI0034610D4C